MPSHACWTELKGFTMKAKTSTSRGGLGTCSPDAPYELDRRSRNGARGRFLGLHETVSLIICLAILNGSASSLASENDGDAEFRAMLARGQALAEKHCSVCHAIGLTGESPTSINRNTSFRRLYERFPIEMLIEAAKTGTISGHDEMPGFDFTLDEVEALLAYIDSLAPGQPSYVKGPDKR
jgi:cytochrome c